MSSVFTNRRYLSIILINLLIMLSTLFMMSCSVTKPEIIENPISIEDIEITGVVIDPYIVGAQVCCDKNSNNACDSDEVTAITNADGSYILNDMPRKLKYYCSWWS